MFGIKPTLEPLRHAAYLFSIVLFLKAKKLKKVLRVALLPPDVLIMAHALRRAATIL